MGRLKAIKNATVHDAEVIEINGGGAAGGATIVDVAFCLDLTGSMTLFLPKIRKAMLELASALSDRSNAVLDGSTIRFGVSCFRDYGDPDGPLLGFLPTAAAPEAHYNALHAFLSSSEIKCHGGDDVAEDVIGGLTKAMQLVARDGKVLSPTANRFVILLFDGPQHGREFHSKTVPVTDRCPSYPIGAPPGSKTLEETMAILRSLKTFVIACGIRPKVTDDFHLAMQKVAPKRDGETMVLCGPQTELFDDEAPRDRFHFIFCLDQSGSMGAPAGSTTRLGGLQQAFAAFVRKRQEHTGQSSEGDLISVATYETQCHELVTRKLLAEPSHCTEVSNVVQSIVARGGTEFYNGLEWCNRMVDGTPRGYTPVVVFMADGGDCGRKADEKWGMVRNIVHPRPGRPDVVFYSVMAFSVDPGDIAVMQQLAAVAGAPQRYHGTPDAEKLSELFSSIAGEAKPIENLVKTVAGHVRDAITQAISSRCY